MNVVDRFERLVEKEPMSGCWLWNGCAAGRYGHFRIGERAHKAHRAAYLIYRGSIPDGLLVCHKCDNGYCVNPDHLFLGTDQDNATDKSVKGRGAPSRQGLPFGVAKTKKRFNAQVRFHGRLYYFGCHATPEEASTAALRGRDMLRSGVLT